MSLDSLAAIEAACWGGLSDAARHARHAWRVLALATVDGEAADVRNVVLRECRPAERQLVIYTDARSPKVSQIAAHPGGTLLAWSREVPWQLRLRCMLTVEASGELVDARWQALRQTPAALDYLAPAAPGAPLEAAARERDLAGHFALLRAEVRRIDWLELVDGGAHRRAVFDASGARWVTP